MDDEQNQNGSPDFGPDHWKPTKEEESVHRLEHLFGQLSRGWKISVIRVEPSWCRGHLETKEIYSPEDQVDIDYLIRTWGGHRIQVKVHNEDGKWIGGASIPLYSYPPMRHGRVLKEVDQWPDYSSPQRQNPQPYYPQNAPAPAAPAQQLDINQILNLVGKQKGGADVGQILKVIEYAQQRQQPTAQMGSMVDSMLGMLSMFREMQSVFGSMTPAPASEESDSMAPIFAEVVKGLISKQQQPPPARGALTPPRRPPPRPVRVARQAEPPRPVDIDNPATAPGPHTVPDSTDATNAQTVLSIADKLSRLDPDDAAGVVMLAMERMPEHKANEAMKAFLSNMGGDDSLDESLNSEHTDYQDDDEEALYADDNIFKNSGR